MAEDREGCVVVYPLIMGMTRKLNSIVDERTAWTTNDEKGQLKRIALTLETIADVAYDAQIREETNSVVSRWLRHLQGPLYRVDDLIEELQHIARNQGGLGFNLPLRSKLYPPIRDILRAIDDMGHMTDRANFLVLRERERGQERKTERALGLWYQRFVGRESDKKAVIDLILRSDGDDSVSVVPITGPACIGKTRLAHLIFNHEHLFRFALKLWIPLGDLYSDDNIVRFCARRYREIFEKSPLEKDDDEVHVGRMALVMEMEMEIQKRLGNTRVLIVLDGLRDTPLHKSTTRELIDMLVVKGSVVIVTTRSRRAASSIGNTPAYHLQPLSQEASYHLFTTLAFGDTDTDRISHAVSDSDSIRNPVEMEALAWEFVNFCSGVPWLLCSIGSYLSKQQTTQEWLLFLQKLQNNDLRIMFERFSPTTLCIPPHLRVLLPSFCLAKPSSGGGGLSVEHLTCIWMALGLLYSRDTAQTPEYIARKYLKEVAETTFCRDFQYAPGGVVRSINFIDLLLEAAFYADPSWVILPSGKVFGSPCTHIIWDQDCMLGAPMPSDCIHKPEEVQLFVVSSPRRQDSALQFVRNVLSSLVRVRVLGLGGCNIEMLPDSICQLRSLRYLDLGRNPRMKSLPDSICNLWHLQTLFLHGCNQLQVLPANIGRLQNLRYLTLTILTNSLPKAIGQLTSLRTLGLTSCQSLASLPPSLKNLKNLETLGIVDCPELDLASTSSVEGFKGLDAISTLLLSYLPKFKSLPSDLGSLSVALRHLQIQSCRSLAEIKWITQFGSMRSLTIEDCPILSDLSLTDGASQLNALSELVIRSCSNLGYSSWIRQFVSLRSLIISNCPKLEELDAGFCKLKNLERLEIRGCPVLTGWFASSVGKNWCHITHIRVIEVDGSSLKS